MQELLSPISQIIDYHLYEVNGANPQDRIEKRKRIASSLMQYFLSPSVHTRVDKDTHAVIEQLRTENWDLSMIEIFRSNGSFGMSVGVHNTHLGERTYTWSGAISFSSKDNSTKLSLCKLGSVSPGEAGSITVSIDTGEQDQNKINISWNHPRKSDPSAI